jgi:hypothetical protein
MRGETEELGRRCLSGLTQSGVARLGAHWLNHAITYITFCLGEIVDIIQARHV